MEKKCSVLKNENCENIIFDVNYLLKKVIFKMYNYLLMQAETNWMKSQLLPIYISFSEKIAYLLFSITALCQEPGVYRYIDFENYWGLQLSSRSLSADSDTCEVKLLHENINNWTMMSITIISFHSDHMALDVPNYASKTISKIKSGNNNNNISIYQ